MVIEMEMQRSQFYLEMHNFEQEFSAILFETVTEWFALNNCDLENFIFCPSKFL